MLKYNRIIADIYLELHKEEKEDHKLRTTTYDTLCVWFVSISTAVIAFLLTKQVEFTFSITSIAMTAFFLTAVLAVVGRIVNYELNKLTLRSHFLFKSLLLRMKAPIQQSELSGSETAKDIYRYMKRDLEEFKPIWEDVCNLWEERNLSSDDALAREFYKKYYEIDLYNWQLGQLSIRSHLKEAFAYTDKEMEDTPSDEKFGAYRRRLRWVAKYSYLGLMVSFLFGLGTLIFGFLG